MQGIKLENQVQPEDKNEGIPLLQVRPNNQAELLQILISVIQLSQDPAVAFIPPEGFYYNTATKKTYINFEGDRLANLKEMNVFSKTSPIGREAIMEHQLFFGFHKEEIAVKTKSFINEM